MMRTSCIVGAAAVLACAVLFCPAAARAQQPNTSMTTLHTYSVAKTVAEMPGGDDFSTPEKAYATMHRRLAAGNDDWKAMSVARLAPTFPKPASRSAPPSTRAARGWLDTQIVEVRIISDRIAYVIGQWPQSGSIDVRCLELEGGRWLNAGQNEYDTLDNARLFIAAAARKHESFSEYRDEHIHPQTYLQPLIDFLRTSVQAPGDFLLQAVNDHKLVIIAQIPHRPAYWELNAKLVSDPHFAGRIGVIYLDLPANDQALLDQFINAESVDRDSVIQILRDVDWMGNPDQSVLDFLVCVWSANRPLAEEKRVRVIAVGPPIDWKAITRREQFTAAMAHREEMISSAILTDLQTRNARDLRHALAILDYFDVAKHLRWRVEAAPIETAGLHLAQSLGDSNCFAILQHGPQISMRGAAMGRTRRGLFDAAFSANDYKPAAFPLSQNPFGGERFDACADWDSAGTFQQAFDGYIFLQKLEDETFSGVIERFYSEDFLREVNRRHQIVNGHPLSDVLGDDELTPQAFQRWLSATWGRPREWRDQIGTINAWQLAEEEKPDE